jgi:hypothetical protein
MPKPGTPGGTPQLSVPLWRTWESVEPVWATAGAMDRRTAETVANLRNIIEMLPDWRPPNGLAGGKIIDLDDCPMVRLRHFTADDCDLDQSQSVDVHGATAPAGGLEMSDGSRLHFENPI